MYSPLRVSMRMMLPVWINMGTFTSAPVSTMAGLVPLVARSSLLAGLVSVTSSSTKVGS